MTNETIILLEDIKSLLEMLNDHVISKYENLKNAFRAEVIRLKLEEYINTTGRFEECSNIYQKSKSWDKVRTNLENYVFMLEYVCDINKIGLVGKLKATEQSMIDYIKNL